MRFPTSSKQRWQYPGDELIHLVWTLLPNFLLLCSQVEMATARALGKVTVLGSLLLQHLLHFSTPGLVLGSLGALTGPQLLALAQSPAGSHVLDAILTSPSVTRKQRRRVLQTLKVRLLNFCLILLCQSFRENKLPLGLCLQSGREETVLGLF
jgi:hypothetical protein